MTIPQEAIEAAAQAWPAHTRVAFPVEDLEPSCEECGEAFGWPGINPSEESKRHREHVAYVALAAALPTLEQQIRAQVAREIEALKLNPKGSTTPHCVEEYNAGLTNAAKIARGKDQP